MCRPKAVKGGTMSDPAGISCPHCGCDDILPFEDEDPPGSNPTMFIVFLSAFLVLTGYFLFMISAYLYFPVVVFISIIVTTRMINKHNREREERMKVGPVKRNYMCVECGNYFTA
jgi:hypothetical protein